MFNEKWRFFKCSGSPKEFYLRDRRYIYFNIYHVPWSQDLCSLIGAIYENSFHGSSATFVEDTFREIQDDIFNNFGDLGKAVAQTARSILWQVNNLFIYLFFVYCWQLYNWTYTHIKKKTSSSQGKTTCDVNWSKAYVLQEYNQHLADQFFEFVNFTGTKCVDREKMFSLFLQQSLNPLRRENGKNFCEKNGVKTCSEKVGDLLYGKCTWWFPPKKFAKQKQALL